MEATIHPGVWLYRSLCTACEIDPDTRGSQQVISKEVAVSKGSISLWSRGIRLPGLTTAMCLSEEYGIVGYEGVLRRWDAVATCAGR